VQISSTDLAAHLRLGITRTARRLRQEAGGSLSPSQSAALATVERHGPLTPSELAQRERVQRPTATQVLGRLEAAGLVQRAADPVDRRSFLVSTTPAGRQLLAAQRTRKDAYLARRLDTLDHADRATLARAAELLERLFVEEGGAA
jgi:DNA-binding MarR family transcriptional regulator